MFGRRVCTLTLLVLLCFVFATPLVTVYADPPDNDNIANAREITALPFTDSVDTTWATWDSPGPGVYACIMDTNVWYKYTPSKTHYVGISIPTNGYAYWQEGMYRGSPGSLQIVGCDDGRYAVEAGQTYYLMIAGGGMLHLTVEDLGPQLSVELALDRRGVVNAPTYAATISGRVSTTRPTWVGVYGEVRQTRGRKSIITGYFSTGVYCDGQATWSVVVSSDEGAYGAGPVEVVATASGCDWFRCEDTQVTDRVFLTRGGGK